MESTIKMFKYSRTSTLIFLNNTDENLWDIQPDKFSNTIRWNAGHVFVTAEDYLTDADENYQQTLPEWDQLFLDGTRPSEWTGDIPTKAEIIDALKEQEERIEKHFENILQEQASVPRDVHGTILDTKDASLQFVTWHEGLHLGVKKSLRNVVK